MVHSFPTRRSSDLAHPVHPLGERAELVAVGHGDRARSEEHTSELQSHHPISYAVFCLKKKKIHFGMAEEPENSLPEERTAAATDVGQIALDFFFNDTATTEIYTGWYTLSLHDALPIYRPSRALTRRRRDDRARPAG